LTQTEYLQNPALRTWTSPDLAAGTWFFAVAAFNSLGLESDLSNIVSKTTSAGATDSRSLALAIQYPSPPTGVQ
jgi:hypothetical protein